MENSLAECISHTFSRPGTYADTALLVSRPIRLVRFVAQNTSSENISRKRGLFYGRDVLIRIPMPQGAPTPNRAVPPETPSAGSVQHAVGRSGDEDRQDHVEQDDAGGRT